MSNVFTLEQLNQEIENRYAPLVFQAGDQEFTLVSLLRISKKARKDVQDRLQALSKSADDQDTVSEDDTVAAMEFALSAVTQDNKGRALVRFFGGDLAKLMILFEQWQKATQSGEASSSPS